MLANSGLGEKLYDWLQNMGHIRWAEQCFLCPIVGGMSLKSKDMNCAGITHVLRSGYMWDSKYYPNYYGL